jgi:pyrroline-5-carboxylate reductase
MGTSRIAFVGGGNMAGAILGGLIGAGRTADAFIVIEPGAEQRAALEARLGIRALPAADASLSGASMLVWAVKPQSFGEAAAACRPWSAGALQLSIMAGIRSDAIVAATGSERVVRAMPNTPALIGQGIAGLYARGSVGAAERSACEAVLAPTGSLVWLPEEADLDAVTALSGSGPAYVFYFIEAMIEAGTQMGLSAEQSRRLAQETFAGAAALAMRSSDSPQLLRERVTSKGGTTHAAIASLESDGVKAAFVRALQAAQRRARELGGG